METYNDLMQALQIISRARHETVKEFGSTLNPAWDKLWRIGQYLAKQANDVLEAR